jgi:cytochrome c biogenesis protein CcmG, thiol:disulfide interchange protein DsbE
MGQFAQAWRTPPNIVRIAVVAVCAAALLAVLAVRLTTASHVASTVHTGSLVGQAAPDFTVTAWNTQGPPVHLAALRGHPVVLNFWGSWCEPCQQESPMLEAAWQRYHSRGVVFVGVAVDTPQSDGLAFLHRYSITYPCGPETPAGQIVTTYSLIGLPATVFIDRNGIVVDKVSEQLTAASLQHGLQAVMR